MGGEGGKLVSRRIKWTAAFFGNLGGNQFAKPGMGIQAGAYCGAADGQG